MGHELGGSCAVTLLLVATSPFAQPAAEMGASGATAFERVRLEYSVPEGCPGVERFVEQVSARVGSAWLAAPDQPARAMYVSVTRSALGLDATLAFADANGRRIARTIGGTDCAEVLTGMAVVTALAIEGELESDATSTAERPGPEPPASEALLEPEPTEAQYAAHKPSPSERHGPATEPVEQRGHRHEAGVAFGVSSGIAPAFALVAGPEWAIGTLRGQPLLRARIEAATTTRFALHDATALWRKLAVRADLCPFGLRFGSALSVPICAAVEGGAIDAQSFDSEDPRFLGKGEFVPWAAGALAPRIRVVSRSAYAELTPSLVFPLVRRTYWFERPRRSVFEVPAVATTICAAGGLRFW